MDRHTGNNCPLRHGAGSVSGMNAAVVNALRVEAIPEPASALLIGCGAALIAVVRRFYGHA